MARDHGRVLCTIWYDPDFVTLKPREQLTYVLLISQPWMNWAGICPVMLDGWAASSDGATIADVSASLDELQRRGYVAVDYGTREVLVRSFMRHNGVAKSANVLTSALKSATAVTSTPLRSILASELRRLNHKRADKAADGIDPRTNPSETLPEGFPNPSETLPEGFANPSETLPEGFAGPVGVPGPQPSVDGPLVGRPDQDIVGVSEGTTGGNEEDKSRTLPEGFPNPSGRVSRDRDRDIDISSFSSSSLTSVKSEDKPKTPKTPKPPGDPAFAEFWAAYPLKKSKVAASKSFAKVVKDGIDPEVLIAGAKRYAAEQAGKDSDFVKHPATWLNKGCWDDEPPPPVVPVNAHDEAIKNFMRGPAGPAFTYDPQAGITDGRS